ncbi:MAG: toxic anion resistance protein [Lachnospiraceae bacterium]|nr:toxic anion resistance protein [Lachnospiraceae bacterium]
MSESLEQMMENAVIQKAPELTVTVNEETVEAPAAPASPISLEIPDPMKSVDLSAKAVAQAEGVTLTDEEAKMVEDFVTQIDINDAQLVLQYGAGAQKKIADFSDTALENVRTKDLGEIGDLLTTVVTELKSFDAEEDKKGGFLGLFKKGSDKIVGLKAKYDKTEANIDKVVKVMEGHQVTLLKDVAMLDKMYEANLSYFKELSLYIIAGKKKLKEAREVELPKLLKKAEESGLPEDSQAARDYAAMVDRFEKKIYDLELTRNISMQMAPQIRLIQNNDTTLSEKIQSTLVNTIPLWKSEMVIAIGLAHSGEAAKAQKEVTDMTNNLLKKNAEALKIATVETAKESERGIVDIETLTQTNQTLISTLDEVMQIQKEGRVKRAEAEAELTRIENEMRAKLLEVSKASTIMDNK